ncbi:tetratricopeptide repeat-containing sensor histidine kinase [Chryseobacterium defluvii]|uniref:Signal transduction histidine kinase n=1 Tax=Chryseobacterium defluvii TaxID=160396 RepID=A0A495SBK8_9FLAO|nr:ATP-binding protein [Chryseobacterium defluvii]RKS96674.1 signal transduction histidine kinase [Chryseobacterium defluvii]
MKYSLLIIMLIILFSCKKEKKELSTQILTTNSYFKKAKEYQKSKISDSAFYYFNLAKNVFLTEKDSLGVARALVNMAIIQSDKGDYYGGIETSLEANTFLKKDKDSFVRSLLASNYNNMGINSKNLKNFDSAISYYNKALKYANIEENRTIYFNNMGDALILQKKLDSAKKYLKYALASKDSINYARALNNLAKAKFLEDENYNPLPELLKALKIREQQSNGMGMNSSYATLADYFFNKNKIASLKYSKMMLDKALQNKSPDDQLEALQKIIPLDPKHYLENFIKFNSINDSLQTARNKAKNQFAVIRYDVEQKNAENQILKRQDAENEIKIVQRNFGLVALSLILITGFFWYKKRKKGLEHEKELEVKNTQLKMSKKVHDVVANGIYQVMTKIENQEHFDKDKALDELEFVYEKSRDISYEKQEIKNEEKDFNEKISELIGSFNNENLNTYLAGNDENIWKDLKESSQEEVYQIVRELLVNMKKHSKADRVVFRFERENNLIKIFYTDNGIGISGDIIYKNGLFSTVSRIETIKGEIIFDTKIEKGLKIYISFPVS